MKKNSLLLRMVVLVAAMMCALGASAAEAYACYTTSNTTLTFYYDNYRSSRTGTTYDLNPGGSNPSWSTDGTNVNVTKVVFDPTFAQARPTSTVGWFYHMDNLQSITGISFLNTSEVTNMSYMFQYCGLLTSIDVSHFNTEKVLSMAYMFGNCVGLTSLDVSNLNTSNLRSVAGMFSQCIDLKSVNVSNLNTSLVVSFDNMFDCCYDLTTLDLSSFNTSMANMMSSMFRSCYNLRTIYVGDEWSTAYVTSSSSMFIGCRSLVGGQGTTYDASHTDKAYAHIDGGTSNPGYFTDKNANKRGDVDGNSDVNMDDLTALINYLLTSNSTGVNMANAATCDSPSSTVVNMDDLTALINYLLTNTWP